MRDFSYSKIGMEKGGSYGKRSIRSFNECPINNPEFSMLPGTGKKPLTTPNNLYCLSIVD
jgi:hypothetical protein